MNTRKTHHSWTNTHTQTSTQANTERRVQQAHAHTGNVRRRNNLLAFTQDYVLE